MLISASHWQLIEPDEWPDPLDGSGRPLFFTPEECADSRDGSIRVHVPTLLSADALRADLNARLIVNSWFRSEEHDRAIGGAGIHPEGRGIDFKVKGELAYAMISLARKHGFTGIGINQHGDHDGRFVHLDTMVGTVKRPRPWVWSYS